MRVSGLESRQAALSVDPDVVCAPIEAGERCHERHHDNAGGVICRSHPFRLAHILCCHSVDPTRTIQSIPHLPGSLWYVFLHSDDAEIERKVYALMAPRGGIVFPYRENRGLARSWNQAMHLAFEAGCDAVLLVNDDLHFDRHFDAGYDLFRAYAAERLQEEDVGIVTVRGLERGENEGMICPQNFSCCIIPKSTVEKIGYFDEAFAPAYFEDLDFARRAILAGLKVCVDQRCLCEHDRSSTLRSSPEQRARLSPAIDQNFAYFCAKWGGLFPPTFELPFNDPGASLVIPLSQMSIGATQRMPNDGSDPEMVRTAAMIALGDVLGALPPLTNTMEITR